MKHLKFKVTCLLSGICLAFPTLQANDNFTEVSGSTNQNSIAVAEQQTVTVKGQVVDKDNIPIIGANIIEKGTTSNGTITDYDGNFTLTITPGATLLISYIGYIDQEIATEGKASINVTLLEDTQTLDELVVVGYSTQRKESLTGALQTIKSEKLKDVTSPSVENLLNGKAPGVYVSPGSGQPGS